MERVCSQCHAVIGAGNRADWCPACGGAILQQPSVSEPQPAPARAAQPTVDHRGIVLPRRHAVGGIITPQ